MRHEAVRRLHVIVICNIRRIDAGMIRGLPTLRLRHLSQAETLRKLLVDALAVGEEASAAAPVSTSSPGSTETASVESRSRLRLVEADGFLDMIRTPPQLQLPRSCL